MRTVHRIAFFSLCFIAALLFEAVSLHLVPDAYAIYGTRRRTARRTAIVVSSATSAQTAEAQQEAAAAEQEAAEANARADAAEQEAAAAQAEADAAKATSGALPIGTVVSALPDGCSKTVIGGVEYYYNGRDYYRAAFQGSQLVYVTAQP